MKSPVVKRSIVIAGHKTSVSLEDAFWKGLKDIAGDRNLTLSDLVATIDTDRQQGNLSSAIRLFVLDHYRTQIAAARTPAVSRDMLVIRTDPSVLRSESGTAVRHRARRAGCRAARRGQARGRPDRGRRQGHLAAGG